MRCMCVTCSRNVYTTRGWECIYENGVSPIKRAPVLREDSVYCIRKQNTNEVRRLLNTD